MWVGGRVGGWVGGGLVGGCGGSRVCVRESVCVCGCEMHAALHAGM